MEQGVLVGKRVAAILMDEKSSLDIDTLIDFKLAELLLEERNELEKGQNRG